MSDFRIAPYPAPPLEPVAYKTPAGENFPVASVLLPRTIRKHVLAFYNLVRLADDIADDPLIDPEVKLLHLDALERALDKGEGANGYLRPAHALRASIKETGIGVLHAKALLQAFRRDAMGAQCRTWDELMDYCRYSAMPVGRYLLELNGESKEPETASDALCAALQILNHLQDCRSDWIELGRCYLPLDWFDEAKISPERLMEKESPSELRQVFDRVLRQVDMLLLLAQPLPRQIQNRRLRLEAAVVLSLAKALSAKLRHDDPLAGHVRLRPWARLSAAMAGLMAGLGLRPGQNRAKVRE